jgi:hypothetical protein
VIKFTDDVKDLVDKEFEDMLTTNVPLEKEDISSIEEDIKVKPNPNPYRTVKDTARKSVKPVIKQSARKSQLFQLFVTCL